MALKTPGLEYSTTGDTWFRITTRGYCAALVVREGIVTQAAPILRRWVGMHWHKVKFEMRRRGDVDIENLSGGHDLLDDEDEAEGAQT